VISPSRTYDSEPVDPAANAPIPPTGDTPVTAESPPHSPFLDTTILWESETADTVGKIQVAEAETVVVVPLVEPEKDIVFVEHDTGMHTPPGTPPVCIPTPAQEHHHPLHRTSPQPISRQPSPTRDRYNSRTHDRFEHPRSVHRSPSRARHGSPSRSGRSPSRSRYSPPLHNRSHSPYRRHSLHGDHRAVPYSLHLRSPVYPQAGQGRCGNGKKNKRPQVPAPPPPAVQAVMVRSIVENTVLQGVSKMSEFTLGMMGMGAAQLQALASGLPIPTVVYTVPTALPHHDNVAGARNFYQQSHQSANAIAPVGPLQHWLGLTPSTDPHSP
jgi:hypothetical protein